MDLLKDIYARKSSPYISPIASNDYRRIYTLLKLWTSVKLVVQLKPFGSLKSSKVFEQKLMFYLNL